jgi:hypothetical protein
VSNSDSNIIAAISACAIHTMFSVLLNHQLGV